MVSSNSNIIDRRKNGKYKSTTIRQKFIKRAKHQIKKAVKEAIEKRNISDIGTSNEDQNTISIPTKGINEPVFRHGNGGNREYVIPGNKDKIVGDTIPKPKGGKGGQGTEGSPDGEGEDDFVFTLTREEFLDFFFSDLELPDMVKTQLKEVDSYKTARAGFTTSGMPVNLNIIRSMRNAIGRRIALQSPYEKEIKNLEEQLEKNKNNSKKYNELLILLEEAKRKKESIPFIDDVDIRYNSFEHKPNPSSKAVMFCLMDVSGSMGQWEKDLAKRFFMLLYLFLERNYEKVHVVFIRHHTSAEEVNEKEFFYDRSTGGTIVSSCLALMDKIIQDRYNSADWNIYAAQASDGDNWTNDGENCQEILHKKIIPYVQYFAYVQIGREEKYKEWGNAFFTAPSDKQLWEDYKDIANIYDNFVMEQIDEPKDIYPVFRKLFKKKGMDS